MNSTFSIILLRASSNIPIKSSYCLTNTVLKIPLQLKRAFLSTKSCISSTMI